MLFPEKMLRVHIVIEPGYVDEVLEKIGILGYLHIDSSGISLGNDTEESRVKSLLGLVQKYMSELNIPHKRKGRLTLTDIEALLDRTEESLLSIGAQVDKTIGKIKSLEQERKKFDSAMAVKKALKALVDIDSLSKNLAYLKMHLGSVSMESAELLRLALKQKKLLVVEAVLFEQTSAVAVFGEEEDTVDISRAFATLKVTEVFPEYCSDEAFALHKKDEEQATLEKKRLAQEYTETLQKMEDRLHALASLEKAKSSLQKGDKGLLLKGWIPQSVSREFVQKIEHAAVTFVPFEGDAPVLLETPQALKPFERLISTFSYPRYGEVNPVIPFAFSFLLLFGIMFGDVGHGFVLAVIGWWVKKQSTDYADLGQIYYLSGLSSLFFGFLYGSVFGVHHWLPHLLFTPIEDVQNTIIFSIGIGIGIITLSFLLHIVTAVKRKESSLLFMSEGSLLWFLVYWFSIGILVKSLVQHMDITYETMILVALLLLILFRMLRKTAEKTQAVIDFFRTFMETITNTVSFLRVGAFALAHGALFMAVFSMAKMISEAYGEGFFYWLLIIVGNVVIIVLEGVIVTIQTLRLEYYEFFKRFFKGGGIPYHPYRLGEKNEN